MSDRGPWSSVGDLSKRNASWQAFRCVQLAEMASISNPYLGQIERGLYKPSADVLKNIAGALRISAESMYAQAGLLDETPAAEGRTTVEEAIRVDAALSNDQKETLIRIYRGFVERKPQ